MMALYDGVYIKSRDAFGFIVEILPEGYTVESAIDPDIIYYALPEKDLYWADDNPAHSSCCFRGKRWSDMVIEGSPEKTIRSLKDLYEVMRDSWCKETAYPTCQDDWADVEDDPSYGQCAISAMIVQDFCGGSIYRMEFETGGTHYYNKIDGQYIDFGAEHFDFEGYHLCYESGKEIDRAYFGKSEDTQKRYQLLCERVSRRAKTKGIYCDSDTFLTYLRETTMQKADFTYKGIAYSLIDGWMLCWEENGEPDEDVFGSQEEFCKSPIFDGKTIEEIAHELQAIRVDLPPDWKDD